MVGVEDQKMLKGTHQTEDAKRKIRDARRNQKSFLIGRYGITQESYDAAITAGLRWCRGCKEFKTSDQFYGTDPRCKTCSKQQVQRWRDNLSPAERMSQAEYQSDYRVTDGAQRVRRKWLTKKYGVSPEWYDAKLAEQGGHCALCPAVVDGRSMPSSALRGTSRLYLLVDHNHETNQARGLLCAKCNTALHRVEYIMDWASKALAYLEKYKA